LKIMRGARRHYSLYRANRDRALMKLGDAIPAKYDLRKLRLLGTVGGPSP